MKNSCYTLVFFLLFPFSLMAQNDEWGKRRVYFTPTRLINLLYPGLEFGYEYRYGRFSSQFSAAYLFSLFPSNYNSLTGYHMKFEEKYYIKKKPSSRRVKFFVSAETSYNYVNLNQFQRFIPPEAELIDDWEEREQYAYEGNMDLHRKAIITNFKFGAQFKSKKIIFENSAGLGIGFQNVTHYNKPNPNDILYYSPSYGSGFPFQEFADKEGFSILPNITISIKIGYVF